MPSLGWMEGRSAAARPSPGGFLCPAFLASRFPSLEVSRAHLQQQVAAERLAGLWSPATKEGVPSSVFCSGFCLEKGSLGGRAQGCLEGWLDLPLLDPLLVLLKIRLHR